MTNISNIYDFHTVCSDFLVNRLGMETDYTREIPETIEV